MRGKYVNIAFNLPVDSLFTYSIPDELSENLQLGMRVLAPLGKQKISGVAIEFIESSSLKKILPVTEVLDINPVINDEMIKFCRWVSGYYFCPLGEVIFSSLPKSTLIETKITFSLNSITLPHAPKSFEEQGPYRKTARKKTEFKINPFRASHIA
jgi:primosomal protein N' (replication factor Y)